MTHGFHRSRKGIVADLSEPEREIVLSLLRQTAELLEDHTGGSRIQGLGETPDGTPDDAAGDPAHDTFEAIMRRAGFVADSDDAGSSRSPQSSAEPTDPAVRRLLPDGHHDDPELVAEFRRLTGDSVRDRKLGHLRRAVRLLDAAEDGRLRPTQEEAVSLLISMTDVRLVLADRLDLDDDEAAESLSERVAEMDPDDPRFALALGYEFLTWLQETLAVALRP